MWPSSGPITPNVGWGGGAITYNSVGKTNCTTKAQNSAGVVVTANVILTVSGYDADGNRLSINCATSTCGAASAPTLPAATGSSGTGKIAGYLGANGVIYSDPAGTIVCSSCTTDGTLTNVGETTVASPPPTDTDVNSTGNDDTTTSNSTSYGGPSS